MQHEFVRPFHFWCQKVLPLVFDDSLSYYEVLAKMRDYLNNAIEEINSIGSEFEGVKTQLTQLKNYVDEYFAGLDVNQAISDKLDDMVESGEMDALITPIFAAYANPIFTQSVADMTATNFAYANYENNKIYTFNQTTGLYQTTGKEFGGVVSSVDEMEDNDKYYALDSNGMLYSYDFPQSTFVETGLTYGGYRYGVNAMRPIANTYVLTTDSHVYTWNGSEYVDTGVVYGLSNTAFIWRKKLDETDNVTTLPNDGWYFYEENHLPSGMPTNADNSSGTVVIYNGLNGNTITLFNKNGGSWTRIDNKWQSNSESGFAKCDDCNSVNWNSSLWCDENTSNKPQDELNGVLKTIFANNEKGQLFIGENAFYRHGDNWHKITNDEEYKQALELITHNSDAIANAILRQTIIDIVHNKQLAVISERVDFVYNKFLSVNEVDIVTENGNYLTAQNQNTLVATSVVVKTDKTLSVIDVPADAKAVGDAITEYEEDVEANTNAIIVEANTRANNDRLVKLHSDELADTLSEVISYQITIENNDELTCENSDAIEGTKRAPIVDKTLSLPDIAGEAKATGHKLSAIENGSIITRNELKKISEIVAVNSSLIEQIKEATTALREYRILSQDDNEIATENNDILSAYLLKQITDTSLSKEYVPADAKTTGDRFETFSTKLSSATTAIAKNAENINELIRVTTTIETHDLKCENNDTLLCENGYVLRAALRTERTDKTLSLSNVAADAKAVGEAIVNSKYNILDYQHITSAFGTWNVPIVSIYGALPTTTSNVNVTCRIWQGNIVLYDGSAKLKVQGSSSARNPEKNYTLKLKNNISLFGYTTDKWNLKCNFTDPLQTRNIVCARTWRRCMRFTLPSGQNGYLTAENGDSILCENNDTFLIRTVYTQTQIQKAPHWGTTDGEFCYVLHDDKFHGLYTIQLSKSAYMFGMDLSSNQFVLSNNGWNFSPFNSLDDFLSKLEIEEASPDMTNEVIYEKVNAFANFIATATDETFMSGLSQYTNPDIVKAYMCFALFVQHWDGLSHNINMYSFDGGNTIQLSAWDMDATLGFSAGLPITVPGFIGGFFGNPYESNEESGTATIGTNIVNALNGNALFARIKSLDSEGFKQKYLQLRSTALSPSLIAYDTRCMLLRVHSRAFDMDFDKWCMKNKTALANSEMPGINTVINASILDQKIAEL